MKNMIFKPASLATIAFAAAFAWGCTKDSNQVSPQQQKESSIKAAQDNSNMIAATQEMMDATSGAFSQQGITEGRVDVEREGSYWKGCKPSISGTFNLNTTIKDSLIYTGTLVIDYGTGTNCSDSVNRRTGKITDTFTYALSLKNKFWFSASESISFTAFKRDTTQFDGVVVIKSSTKSATTVEAQSAKISYNDGTFSTWSGMISFQYDKAKGCRDWGGSTIDLKGSLSGTARDNTSFSANITKDILFKNTCSGKHEFIPVSGTVDISSNGATSTLDYGDGSCDKTYTITASGEVTIHTWDKSSL